MRLTRSTYRGATIAAIATALVAGSVLIATQAQAQTATPASVDSLTARLGGSTAGSYLDQASGKLVVTLTNPAAEAAVRAAGAVPRLVRHSAAQLNQARSTLERSASVAGTAWFVDPVANQVVVDVDSTVSGANLARVRAAAARLGDTVRVEPAAGRFSVFISGGDAIYGGQYRCSLGFNVVSGSTYYFLTAGHCGQVASTWYSNSSHSTLLGSTVSYTFPGHDYALVRYTNGNISHPSAVDLYGGSQTIASAANAYVGESVRRSGSTSHVHSGTVTAVNATVHYSQGTVTGLIRTNVCAEPGDSGGPLFAGSVALGLTSGGNGNCTSGGTTFFQPVTAALAAYGVSVP